MIQKVVCSLIPRFTSTGPGRKTLWGIFLIFHLTGASICQECSQFKIHPEWTLIHYVINQMNHSQKSNRSRPCKMCTLKRIRILQSTLILIWLIIMRWALFRRILSSIIYKIGTLMLILLGLKSTRWCLKEVPVIVVTTFLIRNNRYFKVIAVGQTSYCSKEQIMALVNWFSKVTSKEINQVFL